MSRLAAVLLLVAILAAGDEVPVAVPPPAQVPTPAPLPALFFSASGGTTVSMSPARPSEAKGVKLRYEDILFETETLRYRLMAIPGVARPVLSTADLLGGPDGRVLIDTSATKLEKVSFRGVLRPKTLIVRRQDADPARPTIVSLRVEGSEVGDVRGMINTDHGPRQILAWSDRVVLDLEANLDQNSTTGMSVPRLVAMHLYGPPATPAGDERLAMVLVMIAPVPDAVARAEPQWAGEQWGVRLSSDWLTLQFDEKGNLMGYSAGNKGEYAEKPGQGLILRRVPTSVPIIGK